MIKEAKAEAERRLAEMDAADAAESENVAVLQTKETSFVEDDDL